MREENIHLIGEILEACNAHHLERLASFYAPDYQGTDVGDPREQRGPGGSYAALQRYVAAFPDLQVVTEEVVVDGERVALSWRARGTQRGTFMHIPPTGRTVEVRGMSFLTVRGGRVARGCSVWDVAGLLRGLGLLPQLAT